MDLEAVDCLLCGPSRTRTLVEADPHRVERCEGCGLAFVTPRLTEAAREALYRGDYFASPIARERGYTDYLADADCYRRTFEMRARPLVAWRARGAVFEAGCAAGFFLRAMADHGWSVYGTDLNAGMVAHARDTLGLEDVVEGRVEDWDGRGAPYDLIALWDVLEHVNHPLAVLTHVRPWLADDGLLLIETQNVESLAARWLGARWHHYKHGEHLYHFSPTTIATVLERAGYELVRWTRRGAGKVIPYGFVVERSQRVMPALAPIFARLDAFEGRSFYVNPMDEMIVTARRAGPAPGP